jgi:hypothetical protein
MPTVGHIRFIERHRNLIREPVLIVGSKIYDYDQEHLQAHLRKWGISDICGADLAAGDGVDLVLDIADTASPFWKKHQNHFKTVFCMEILTHVGRPFDAARNITGVAAPGAALFLAECTTRKISKMPSDLWRFTLEGLKALFDGFEFSDRDAAQFLTRMKGDVNLTPWEGRLPEILRDQRHADESPAGFLLRKIHRRFFSRGVFGLSRYLPESTVCAVGRKK